MKKIIISLHGAYYGNNYGDILLLNIFARWIKEEFPQSILNMPLANRKETLDLPKGTTNLMNLFRSKALVFFGGGYFGERPVKKERWARRNFLRYGLIGLLAFVFNIPYAIIGVEFGPISTVWFRKVAVFIARHAKYIVVRNRESKEFLENNGVKNVQISADAVLTLSDYVNTKVEKKNRILLHIPGITKDPQKYHNLINHIMDLAGNKKVEIAFIRDNFNEQVSGDNSRTIFDILEKSSAPYTVFSYKGYESLVNLINCSRYVVTTKLHVGITAAALNIRPLSLWTHPKTPRFYAQINNSDYCFPLSDLENIRQLIDRYLSCPNDFIIPPDLREMASLNKKALLEFLNNYLNK